MPDIRKTLNFDEAEIKFTGDGTQGVFEGYAPYLVIKISTVTLFYPVRLSMF